MNNAHFFGVRSPKSGGGDMTSGGDTGGVPETDSLKAGTSNFKAQDYRAAKMAVNILEGFPGVTERQVIEK